MLLNAKNGLWMSVTKNIIRAVAVANDGFIVINKPKGMTSHDVVSCARRVFNTKKIGHGGTLDPMATGVLVLAVGKATRMLQYVSSTWKSYSATVVLGAFTDTDDAMGQIIKSNEVEYEGLQQKLNDLYCKFTGTIMQAPSKVSAIKINGRRAYELARNGENVEIPKREITIYSLKQNGDIRVSKENSKYYEFDIEVVCSSGTYVRSIARDIGVELKCGGYLSRLERKNVGDFTIEDAFSIEELNEFVKTQNCFENPSPISVMPLVDVAKKYFPYVVVSEKEKNIIKSGGFLDYKNFVDRIENNLNKGDDFSFSTNNFAKNEKSRCVYLSVCKKPVECAFSQVLQEENLQGAQGEFNAKDEIVALMERRGNFIKPLCVF